MASRASKITYDLPGQYVWMVTGDSWAVTNSGGHAGNDHTVPIIDELIRQNPGKRIRVVNRRDRRVGVGVAQPAARTQRTAAGVVQRPGG